MGILNLCPVADRFHLPYVAYHEDAEKRHARGEEQQKCGTCERCCWPDHRQACPSFTTNPGTQ